MLWIYTHNFQKSGIDSDDILKIDDGEQSRSSIDLGIFWGMYFSRFSTEYKFL